MNNQHYKVSLEEAKLIRKKMRSVKKNGAYQRLLIIALRGEGKTNVEIAEIVGVHQDTVGKLAKKYASGGIEALLQDGRKGGNNRNMNSSEEDVFLNTFVESAQNGHLLTVGEIAKAYDERTGKSHASHSAVYYLLHKHGWRKVMPRSKHPNKASDEAIEASKKLTTSSEARWKIIPPEQ